MTIEELAKLMNSRFEMIQQQMTARFKRIDEHLDRHDEYFAALSEKVNQIDQRVDDLQAKVSYIDERTERIEEKVTQIDQRLLDKLGDKPPYMTGRPE